MKKKIVIIGCGFGGFFASQHFLRHKGDVEVTVIDRKESFDFLPVLPDSVGRNINPDLLAYPIRHLSQRFEFNFINEEVKSVDIDKNIVLTSERNFNYDYLIIASGSETNFYGNEQIKKYAYKLDDVLDTRILLNALEKKNFDCFIISGGGYTGIELATNLRVYLNKKSIRKKIIIVEKLASILGPLPEWMKTYTYNNLKRLGIDVFPNTTVDKVAEGVVSLSNGQIFNNAMLVWVAGVKTADFLRNINAEKNPQGRIKLDEYLRLKDNCFVVGDCAYIRHKNSFLRMAVQFAIYQALSAASNIIRSSKGLRLDKYRPIDLGYIIPMANNQSCGSIMGLNVTGLAATMMHFTMCVYRSYGLKNKLGIIKALAKGGG